MTLDRLGFGPQTMPSRSVRSWRLAHLFAYQAANEQQPAILIVPAPIKTAYIWDLAPGSSAVERFVSAGLQVYMAVWQRPGAGDEGMGLADYADKAICACLDEIYAETGRSYNPAASPRLRSLPTTGALLARSATPISTHSPRSDFIGRVGTHQDLRYVSIGGNRLCEDSLGSTWTVLGGE